MTPCRLYPDDVVEPLIDFGAQPLTNRFISGDAAAEETFPLRLGVSRRNGIVQQFEPARPEAVRARYSWIKYNEAEEHLDHLVADLTRLPGVTRDGAILGLTYKDASTLARLSASGMTQVRSVDADHDLGCTAPNAGLETIQQQLTPAWANGYTAQRGRANIVIARHIFEHAHQPTVFLRALEALALPGAYVVIEVPDSSSALASLDYTMPWEEHVFYFTPKTFQRALAASPFDLIRLTTYPYVLENSLVAILRKPIQGVPPCGRELPARMEEFNQAQRYAQEFPKFRAAMTRHLADFRSNRGKIAILGAGHAACTFINLLGIGDFIEFIVDDSPSKQSLLFPGNRKPIKSSATLITDGIRLCLLAVNHNTEDKVIAKNDAFARAGGEFRSIFPASQRHLAI